MLQLTNLTTANLAPITLSLQPGEILALAGPSGSGKTRLLRAIADLDPHDGTIHLDDREQQTVPAHDWRRRVMLVPAESQWWFERVAEHFPHRRVVGWQAVGFAENPADWSVARLSTGEKQRLSLLRAFAHQPEVALLDEPTANLDEVSRRRTEDWLVACIRERQMAAIWVAHDADQIQRVADQGGQLVGGRLEVGPCR